MLKCKETHMYKSLLQGCADNDACLFLEEELWVCLRMCSPSGDVFKADDYNDNGNDDDDDERLWCKKRKN